MANNETSANGIERSLVAIVVVGLVYVASFGPMWSLAVRTRMPTPFTWAIYRPIPETCQMQMLRIWGAVDPEVEVALRSETW
jgi:hypothetical protein